MKKRKLSDRDKKLCFYSVMKSAIIFRDKYMGPATGKYYVTRYYQYGPALSDSCCMFGGRSMGKCLPKNTKILLSNGKYEEIENLVGSNFSVVALSKNKKLKSRQAKAIHTGEKECLKITTASGREIKTSIDHKLLTVKGWKSSCDLNSNSYIAAFRKIRVDNSNIYWDRIKNIEKIGILDCYDISVDIDHNFIAEDFFVHNSYDLEGSILQCIINNPNDESLLTAFRKTHIKDREENVITYLQQIPYFRAFVKSGKESSISRSPIYSISLKNGHHHFGISIGDDPAAIMIQGHHPQWRFGEEFQAYPESAWVKWQSTQDPRGSVDRYYGTCLLPDSPIHCKDGIKNIQDINTTDLVLTHTGKFEKVNTLLYRNYSGKICCLKSQLCNIPIKLTEDHKIYSVKLPKWLREEGRDLLYYLREVRKGRRKFVRGEIDITPKWNEAKELENNDYIVFPLKVAVDSKEILKSINLLKFCLKTKGSLKKYLNHNNIKSVPINDDFIKVSAAYIAEGSAEKTRLTFTFNFKEPLFYIIKQSLNNLKLNYTIIHKELNSKSIIRVSNAPFTRMTVYFFNKGAQYKELPSWIYNLNKDQIELFFDILIMGDGHIRKRKKAEEIVLTSISRKLILDLQLLSLKINKYSSVRIRQYEQKKRIFNRDKFCNTKTVYELGYNKNKFLVIHNDHLYLKIKSLEKQNYKGKVYNIEVNNHKSYCSYLFCLHNCDGRLETPFRKLDTVIKKFEKVRFHIPRLLEPYFNQEIKNNLIESLGGEDSDEYMQQTLAEWGEPIWGVWDEQAISDCLDKKEDPKYPGLFVNKIKLIEVTAKSYKGQRPGDVLNELLPLPKDDLDVILGIDSGYTSPTMILPFFFYEGKWNLKCRIVLKDKIIADDQAELIDYIATYYNSGCISIDCTSSEGKAPATTLANPKNIKYNSKGYEKRIIWTEFNKYMTTGWTKDGKEIKDKVKNATTNILRKMFARQNFLIYNDEDLLEEFNREAKRKTPTGDSILTPDNVHIPEAFRCFAFGYFTNFSGVQKPKSEVDYGFQLPFFEDGISLFGRD